MAFVPAWPANQAEKFLLAVVLAVADVYPPNSESAAARILIGWYPVSGDGVSSLTFPKSARLLTSAQFQRIFKHAAIKVAHPHFLILACPNTLNRARLGLVVGKKHCRLAVGRNRLKRHIRETFRHWQHYIKGIDAIVLPRSGAAQQSDQQLQQTLNQQWQRLAKQLPTDNQSQSS